MQKTEQPEPQPAGRGAEVDPAPVTRPHAHDAPGQAWMDELSVGECLDLLRLSTVGRIAVLVDDYPAILPVNHRLVEAPGGPLLVLRTRAGTSIDRAGERVAFEVDGVDVHHRQGWSVLVRGVLRHVDKALLGDEEGTTWLPQRDVWLVVEPHRITGRRLHASPAEWPFHPHGYL